MIRLHLGDFESIVLIAGLSVGFACWGVSKLVDSYFSWKLKELERKARDGEE